MEQLQFEFMYPEEPYTIRDCTGNVVYRPHPRQVEYFYETTPIAFRGAPIVWDCNRYNIVLCPRPSIVID